MNHTAFRRALVLGATGLAMAFAVAQVGEGPPVGAADPAPAPAGGIKDLSTAEVDTELRNLEQVLRGGTDPGERAADKPLPADLAVPLPSDI
jgi:hypothetical protein